MYEYFINYLTQEMACMLCFLYLINVHYTNIWVKHFVLWCIIYVCTIVLLRYFNTLKWVISYPYKYNLGT